MSCLLSHIFKSPAVSVRFGLFGREPHSLVLILSTGALVVKILRRNTDLNKPVVEERPVLTKHDVPLPIPKKTRLYLELAMKEQKNSAGLRAAIFFLHLYNILFMRSLLFFLFLLKVSMQNSSRIFWVYGCWLRSPFWRQRHMPLHQLEIHSLSELS